jgi:hypothetical protein
MSGHWTVCVLVKSDGVILSVSSSTKQFSPLPPPSSPPGLRSDHADRCMMTCDHFFATPLGLDFPDAVPDGDGVRWACLWSNSLLRLKVRRAGDGPKLCRRGMFRGAASVVGTINLINHSGRRAVRMQ